MNTQLHFPRKALPWILLQIVAVSAVIVLSRFLLEQKQNISSLGLAASIQLISGLILLSRVLFTRPRELKIDSKNITGILLVSIIGTGLSYGLGYIGLARSTATNYSFLFQSSIFFVPVLAHFFLSEKFTNKKILLTLIFSFGIFLVTTHGKGILPHPGDLLILIAALCFSLSVIVSKQLLGHLHPDVFATYRPLLAALFMFLLAFIFEPPNLNLLRPLVLVIGILLSLANIGYTRALFYASAGYLVLMNVMVPVLTTLIAFVFLHEHLTFAQIAGGGIILFTAVFFQLLEIRQNAHEEK